jgi:UDP-N-acetylmuramate dehydrogenase
MVERAKIAIKRNEPLAQYSHICIGGTADFYCEPCDRRELRACIEHCRHERIQYKVIGGGCNVLFADHGFRGCIISMRQFEKAVLHFLDNSVFVSAGMSNTAFIRACAEKDLGGMEFLGCIPGTIGGALIMNAGCKDHSSGNYEDIGSFVISVSVFDQEEERTVSVPDIQFAYRSSSLNSFIVLGAEMRIGPRTRDVILATVKQNMDIRSKTVPWDRKTLGSVFKNPVGDARSAGALLDKAGMKGESEGDIIVSLQHANIFENRGKGTAKDMLALIARARQRVYETSGIRLELEIDYIE